MERPPRHRFSEDVRSATRAAAARMVKEGSVVGTAEELDAWIAREPAVRASMERGGYGSAFTADDLLPLLHVLVEKGGGVVPRPHDPAAEAPSPARSRWPLLLAALLLVSLLAWLALNR